MKHSIKLAILFLLYSLCSFGQDSPFSNMNSVALYLNPACTGVINRDIRIGSVYRSQGKSIAIPYTTYGAQADLTYYPNKDKSDFLGFGFNFIKHNEGVAAYKQTSFNFSSSFTKVLNSDVTDLLTVGIQGGMMQRAMDLSTLHWDSQWDPNKNIWNTTFNGEYSDTRNIDVYDIAAGLLYNKKINDKYKFNAGVAMHHIFEPTITMDSKLKQNYPDNLHKKYTFHGSGEISTSQNATTLLVPSFVYSVQKSQKLFMIGLDLKYLMGGESKFTDYIKQTAISFGLSYRWQDAFIPHCKIDYKEFTFFLAYDATVSNLTTINKSFGAYEFAMIWNLKSALSSRNKPRVFKFIQ